MSDSQALIVRNDAALSVSFSESAEALKESALCKGALVGRVTCAEEQQAAVDAQKEVAVVLKLAEDAREAAKRPVLEYGRRIDGAAAIFVQELKDERIRLAKLVGDFQTLEEAKIRAARNAENERLAQLERDRQAELANAKSHEELDMVNEKFDLKTAEEVRPLPAPVRAEGQIVKTDWELVDIDLHTLYRWHPHCVKLEARLSEIKALLTANKGDVRGVTAKSITKASVRADRETRAISV